MIDAEHILGILLLLFPREEPAHLADQADLIGEIAENEDEAIAMVLQYSTGRLLPYLCCCNFRCLESVTGAWREAARVCGSSSRISQRYSYLRTSRCESTRYSQNLEQRHLAFRRRYF